MRSKAGWGVSLLGVLVALLGLALMIVLGPDDRITSGPHAVETDGIAVVTAPKALSWADVQISVLAEVPADKPVFVGLGNAVDVTDYIRETQRLEVTGYETPWTVKTREIKGNPNLPAAPTALDWWIADGAGLGGAGIDTSLPDETVSLAILAVGFSNLNGLEVTVAYGIKGGFAKGAGLLLLGIGGLWFGHLLRRDQIWRKPDDEFDHEEFDEVVYVYIDEAGVEHEISAEEAAAYDVEDVSVEEFVVDEVGELPEPATTLSSTPTRALTPKSQPVVYVYIDEDGVEHEVSEDELHDYEFLEDEEDERP